MSKYSEYLKSRKESDMNFFFGEGNVKHQTSKYFTFKKVLDDDNIIVLTNNIKHLFNSNTGNAATILMVDNNKAVYLKSWQIKSVTGIVNVDEVTGQGTLLPTYAVKLNRNYFKVYTFKSNFEGMMFEKEDTFDSLKEDAKLQEVDNIAIKLG